VVAVQEIVSREINPFDQAVITVGSFHGGLKHNIISDSVKLQITVRSYKPEVREKLLAGIARIAKAEALAGRSPKEPEMKIIESTPALYNDPALTEKVMTALGVAIGPENLTHPPAEMGSEDFSEFVNAGVPGVYLQIGAVAPAKFAQWKDGKVKLPSTHSPFFAPDVQPTLKTAILAETVAALTLLH
jgi:hippurate hydrolase